VTVVGRVKKQKWVLTPGRMRRRASGRVHGAYIRATDALLTSG